MTELCEIMGRHGSDKGPPGKHTYTTLYDAYFARIRDARVRIFELGIGTRAIGAPSTMASMPGTYRPGASLRGWREYFTQGSVFAADIDRGILLDEERISTFYCDQTSRDDICALWQQPALLEGFDVLIDDGLHTYEANMCFLENSIPKVNAGGYYIIEDVHDDNVARLEAQMETWDDEGMYRNFCFSVHRGRQDLCDDNVLVAYRES